MKYLTEILGLVSWPVLIYVSYRVIVWAIEKFEELEKAKPEE
ncbi:MAG TPA: hypothetical protein VMW01_08365 [Williamwhitmania sp.]|nr:hypothetical protein [Williamwhitmania sp.]